MMVGHILTILKEYISFDLDDLIREGCNEKGLPAVILFIWKYSVLTKIDSCIRSVIVPIDKANGKISFKCKRFYALIIMGVPHTPRSLPKLIQN